MSELIPAHEVLHALLTAHGYDAHLKGDRVVVTGHEAQWSGEIHTQKNGDEPMVQVDIAVHLPGGHTVIESFAGIGSELQYALGDAFNTFTQNSFHVLLSAFFGGNECEVQEWPLPTGRFRVFISGATFRGDPPGEGEEMVEWYNSFALGIAHTPLDHNGPHWIRLYYGQHERKTMMCEVLLDNEVWEGAQEAMAQYPWLEADEFYSARLFMVLVPVTV